MVRYFLVMPGLIAFGRRWSIGSDDFVLCGFFLFVLHVIWLIALGIILGIVNFDTSINQCAQDLYSHVLGYIVILAACIISETFIVWLSMRGTILYTKPRSLLEYAIYARTVLLVVELIWLVLGSVWVGEYYILCPTLFASRLVLGILVCNWCILLAVICTSCCIFGKARPIFKMKYSRNARFFKKNQSFKERLAKIRQTRQMYGAKWQKRCNFLHCFAVAKNSEQETMAEVAKLLCELFQDQELDLVTSDVISALFLLRWQQKKKMLAIQEDKENGIYQFLSGVPITPRTRFLNLGDPYVEKEFLMLIHFCKYALAAYGWPLYVMMNPINRLCKIWKNCRCCCYNNRINEDHLITKLSDNSCQCHFAALKKQYKLKNLDIIYSTFHSVVSSRKFNQLHSQNSMSADSIIYQCAMQKQQSDNLSYDHQGMYDLIGETDETAGCHSHRKRQSAGDCLNANDDQNNFCLHQHFHRYSNSPSMTHQPFYHQDVSYSPPLDSAKIPLGPSYPHSCMVTVKDGDDATVCESPFFVALDHKHKKVVISISGTLSLDDCITDLSADSVALPLDGHEEWFGHKGIVVAAACIKNKLNEGLILEKAFSEERGTQNFDLILVGYSLGAGVATILSLLLRSEYPSLICYAYSPPGGLLSMAAADHSKEFVTSVVVGKDVFIRVGLSQIEYLRTELLDCLKRSNDPKWRIIAGELFCCCKSDYDVVLPPKNDLHELEDFKSQQPSSSQFSLSLFTQIPLYPPGKIIHIVRNHPKRIGKETTFYNAIWADNKEFDEVIVSPVMLHDHLPENLLAAMENCIENAQKQRVKTKSGSTAHNMNSSMLSLNHDSEAITLKPIHHQSLSEDYLAPSTPHSSFSSLSWEYTSPHEKEAAINLEIKQQLINELRCQSDLACVESISEFTSEHVMGDLREASQPAPLAKQESLSESDSESANPDSFKSSLNSAGCSGNRLSGAGYCYYVDVPSFLEDGGSEEACRISQLRKPNSPGVPLGHSYIEYGPVNPEQEFDSHLY